MKPTKEEILSDKLKKQAERVAFEDGSGIMFIRYSFDARELQEYAEQFHKEKMREELIHFAGYHNDLHFPNAEAKYMISIDEIKEYLKTLNTK